jgi:alanine dehydrogenase
MLMLSEQDVERLLTIKEAIGVLVRAFRVQDEGQAMNRARERVRSPGGAVTMHLLGAALGTEGVIGFKAYTSSRQGVRFMVMLYDGDMGVPLCLIEADRMGQIRTGAATGLATQLMARPDAATLGIYGSGYQAETQAEAVCAVRSIREVWVHSRSEEKRDKFARQMSERLGISVKGVEDPKQAAQADVVLTVTTAQQPVLMGDWLRPGVHVNAVGANNLTRREIDDAVVRRAAAVVVDSREQALREAADLVSPMERGWLVWERVWEIREVVSGARQGRSSPEDVTLFKSLGIGLEDVAVGAFVYKKASEQGLGENINFLV